MKSRRPAPKQPPPAYQWYPKDHFADPAMTLAPLEAEGLYRRLYDYAWLENGLPDDLAYLHGISKCRSRKKFDELWAIIAHKFPVSPDGRRRNPDQERQRKERKKFSQSRKAAADKRWEGHRQQSKPSNARASNADARALHVECSASASALASASADEVQVSQIHRRAARAGLAADRTAEERDLRRLTALCHGDLIRPYVMLTNRVPDRSGLIAALVGHAADRTTLTCTEAQATAAVDRALARWSVRRSA